MPLHHTEDLARRAEHVAEREAEEVWRTTHDYGKWSTRWSEVYDGTLEEFGLSGQERGTERWD